MRSALPILQDNLKIASPCDASWEDMTGNDQHRFCDQCEKNVYNLRAMEPEELVELIEKTEGKFCGRIYRRQDGTVLSEDCPVGFERVRRAARRAKRRVFASAALVASMAVAGLQSLSERTQPEPDCVKGPAKVSQRFKRVIHSPAKKVQTVVKKIEKKIPPPEPDFDMGDMVIEPDQVEPYPVIELGEVLYE